jgi:hypothetical protein
MAIPVGDRRPPRLWLLLTFSCGINGLASGCHGSLDLLVDHADATVTRALKDAGNDGADSGRPSRVPPIPCQGDEQCAAVGGVCVSDKGICGECVQDTSCSGQRRRCDPATNECVGCLDAAVDCPNGWLCDQTTRMCTAACTSRSDCTPLLICSQIRHVCTQCDYDSDCGGFAQAAGVTLRCRSGLCNECESDHDCPPDRKSCDLRFGFCEGCRTNDQCPPGSSCTPLFPNTDFLRRCQTTP